MRQVEMLLELAARDVARYKKELAEAVAARTRYVKDRREVRIRPRLARFGPPVSLRRALRTIAHSPASSASASACQAKESVAAVAAVVEAKARAERKGSSEQQVRPHHKRHQRRRRRDHSVSHGRLPLADSEAAASSLITGRWERAGGDGSPHFVCAA